MSLNFLGVVQSFRLALYPATVRQPDCDLVFSVREVGVPTVGAFTFIQLEFGFTVEASIIDSHEVFVDMLCLGKI